jgi:hypothetical protein
MIDVLSPKDFDMDDFRAKCSIFLGDEHHPIERELVGETDGETN